MFPAAPTALPNFRSRPSRRSGNEVGDAIVVNQVLGIEQAACSEFAICAKIAVEDEDQEAVRIEKSECDALDVLRFGCERASSAVLQATGIDLIWGALDETTASEPRSDVGGGR